MSLYETLVRSWAVEALVWSALLMLAVLLVRGPAQRLFGARVAYALWALPALRMALPRIPGLEQHWRIEFGGPELFAGGAPAVAAAPLSSTDATIGIVSAAALPPLDAVPQAVAPDPIIHWPALLLVLWLGGALLFLNWQLLAHRRFMAAATADADLVQRAGGITILSAPGVPGPLATGVWRRLILLPADFTQRYAPAERRLVLAHEVAHHCRGDLIANMAALLLLSLHWFNPLAHRAYRLFRADQELACDETVLAHEPSPDARADYGRAIVRTVARRAPVAACTMHAAGLLKRRLQMMTLKPRGLMRLALGVALGTGLVGGGLAVTASGTMARAEMTVPPTPPMPPAPPAPFAAAAPEAPPAPQRLGANGRSTVVSRGGSRHLEVRNGREIWLNGRAVDPDSAEGRALLAEAEQARREGERAAAEGRRAAAEGLRAAEAGRRAGEAGRLAGLRAAEDGRRAADAARRAGEAGRLAGLRAADAARMAGLSAADEGRREAAEARREAAQERAAAQREAAEARAEGRRAYAEAMREGADARREAYQAAAEARAQSRSYAYVDGKAIRAEVNRSLAQARADIARDRSLSDQVRAQTLRALDASIARQAGN